MSNINPLQTKLVHNQGKSLRKLVKLSLKGKCIDPLSNSSHQLTKKMYIEQSGEFVGHLWCRGFFLLHRGQAEGRRRYFLIIARTIKMHSENICRKGTFSIKFLHFLYIKENDQQRTALSIFRKRTVYLSMSIYKLARQKKKLNF